MAGASGGNLSSSSKGGKRSLDAEINLVPFIDLLSMCICFLLMTAVWLQVASMPVKQSRGTEAPAEDNRKFDLDIRFASTQQVDLLLKKKNGAVRKQSVKADSAESLVEKLKPVLEEFARFAGEGNIASGMVTPKQGVNYGTLVAVMDQLRAQKIVNLGVVPVGGSL